MKFNLSFLKKQKITLATKLTLLRIILVPFIVFFIIKKNWLLSFFLICISAVTDLFDGIIARKRNETTILGAILDPMADKLFILSCYILLSLGYFPSMKLPWWFTLIIFLKELLLISGAIYLNGKYGFIEVRPTILGKITMDINTLFILWIFISYFFNFHFEIINKLFIFTIVILVLLTFLQYANISLKQVKQR